MDDAQDVNNWFAVFCQNCATAYDKNASLEDRADALEVLMKMKAGGEMVIKEATKAFNAFSSEHLYVRKYESIDIYFPLLVLILLAFSALGILVLRFSRRSSLSAFLRSCEARDGSVLRSPQADDAMAHLFRLLVLVSESTRLSRILFVGRSV